MGNTTDGISLPAYTTFTLNDNSYTGTGTWSTTATTSPTFSFDNTVLKAVASIPKMQEDIATLQSLVEDQQAMIKGLRKALSDRLEDLAFFEVERE